jgi:hypothetical protein
METEVSVLLPAALNGHSALCSRVVVQGDHKLCAPDDYSTKQTRKNILNIFKHLPR